MCFFFNFCRLVVQVQSVVCGHYLFIARGKCILKLFQNKLEHIATPTHSLHYENAVFLCLCWFPSFVLQF